MTPGAASTMLDDDGRQEQAYFAGFAVTAPDLEPIRSRLAERDIAHHREGARLVVPAGAAFGCTIVFEQG
jgi:hypothetical protein